MSRAWLRVEEVRDTLPNGSCTVRYTVTQAYAVPSEVFVFRTDTQEYSHVAVADELTAWPTDREDALVREFKFYRVPSATITALTRTALEATTAHVRRRLSELAEVWDPDTDLPIPGRDTFTYGGDL